MVPLRSCVASRTSRISGFVDPLKGQRRRVVSSRTPDTFDDRRDAGRCTAVTRVPAMIYRFPRSSLFLFLSHWHTLLRLCSGVTRHLTPPYPVAYTIIAIMPTRNRLRAMTICSCRCSFTRSSRWFVECRSLWPSFSMKSIIILLQRV